MFHLSLKHDHLVIYIFYTSLNNSNEIYRCLVEESGSFSQEQGDCKHLSQLNKERSAKALDEGIKNQFSI